MADMKLKGKIKLEDHFVDDGMEYFKVNVKFRLCKADYMKLMNKSNLLEVEVEI